MLDVVFSGVEEGKRLRSVVNYIQRSSPQDEQQSQGEEKLGGGLNLTHPECQSIASE